ncbi:oligopeptide/dipeptide ABC transporter ATP-binding protein [Desulfoscipio sp. XC116]|uniref:ABC transporter ATP-binding protein n=1 Tax=Desulfoscipio sp. XC116 TaxID=3144975 RepID=UPI00325AACFF
MSLLNIQGLIKYHRVSGGVFSARSEKIHAVDGIFLTVEKGETLGLVGESGCGKSTLARLILRLEDPDDGRIIFNGRDITGLGKKMHDIRRRMQMIFQDTHASLNPRMTVGAIIGEPLVNYRVGMRREQKEKVLELLQTVGLNPEHAARYPHEFSGGQRQRIGIARALALQPDLVVCDEPVSSLDVSVRAQILNLLLQLKKQLGLAYLFISHDLTIVSCISDRVAIMYLGKIVEVLPGGDLVAKARHPYTRALLAAVPVYHPRLRDGKELLVEGEPPDPASPPAGCRFHPRCPKAREKCRVLEPLLEPISAEHQVACHWAGV